MSATEILIAMLDERGVDHEDYEGAVVRTTSWTANDGQSVTFMERLDNGKTMFGFDVSAFTPEEAVAATLGPVVTGGGRMTLDEAIEHANEVAETCDDSGCAADHIQLAEWLRQARGAGKAARWYTSRIQELEAENAKLRKLCADMHKALFSLNLDHCQACPREDACVFMHKSFDCDECAFERDMRKLGVEVN